MNFIADHKLMPLKIYFGKVKVCNFRTGNQIEVKSLERMQCFSNFNHC